MTKTSWPANLGILAPGALGVIAVLALGVWFWRGANRPLAMRVPGTDQAGGESGAKANPVLTGKRIAGEGKAANLPGAWPRFRGPEGDGISHETTPLLHAWLATEPRPLWGIDVGEGYAGPAVFRGRVYLMDYDRDQKQDALRCLSLEDGRELWRYVYTVSVKRNHGMSRTVPAVTEKIVVAMGPKCHVVCLNPESGELRWGLDLVRQFGTTVPPWYAGQCPLVESNNTVILAPGGKDALLLAVAGDTGQVLWQSPNPHAWKMTHSSVVPMEFAGRRFYIYCANGGVVGVSAKDGAILWETTAWKISLATVPSPLVLDGGRIFLSGGYNAGSLMLQLKEENGQISASTLFKLDPEVFGATQHTPILHQNHIYGVRPDNRFVCLTTEGKTVWVSDSGQQFGLGPFLLADGVIFAMNDSGLLRLIDASPDKYKLLGQAQVLKGHDSWGPLALAGGRLLARDLTHLVCLDVAKH